MKMLAFLENMNSTYGGPAFSLPSLLNTLRNEYSVYSEIISLKKQGETYNNRLASDLGFDTVLLKKIGYDKLKYTPESVVAFNYADDYDVIHTNNLWNYFSYLPYNISKKGNKANVISVRGALYPWSLEQSRGFKKLAWCYFQREAIEKAAFIHVTCQAEYSAVRDLGIKSKIVISEHGVDVPELISDIPSGFFMKYGLTNDKKYFLFMSRLHTKKGLDILLNVWSSMMLKFPEWVLLIAGPDYGNYIPKIKSLESNNIKYMGMLDGLDKEYCFAISRFFVLPSYTENFGVVIGEAMARAVPVLTTTNTPWEIVNTQNAGVCFELSSNNLEKELHAFLNTDAVTLKNMGLNARKLIEKKYSWDRVSYPFYEALKSL